MNVVMNARAIQGSFLAATSRSGSRGSARQPPRWANRAERGRPIPGLNVGSAPTPVHTAKRWPYTRAPRLLAGALPEFERAGVSTVGALIEKLKDLNKNSTAWPVVQQAMR